MTEEHESPRHRFVPVQDVSELNGRIGVTIDGVTYAVERATVRIRFGIDREKFLPPDTPHLKYSGDTFNLYPATE